ncbi:putative polyA polymerase [Actinobacillus pleuropneumoniae]|nr:putative polyA polymerase [Actinobacillus pleuropneumoniae]
MHKKFTVNAGHYDITPKDFPKNALAIVEKLQRAGFEAYVVGGCIRDLLLGISRKILMLRPMQNRKKFKKYSVVNAV